MAFQLKLKLKLKLKLCTSLSFYMSHQYYNLKITFLQDFYISNIRPFVARRILRLSQKTGNLSIVKSA